MPITCCWNDAMYGPPQGMRIEQQVYGHLCCLVSLRDKVRYGVTNLCVLHKQRFTHWEPADGQAKHCGVSHHAAKGGRTGAKREAGKGRSGGWGTSGTAQMFSTSVASGEGSVMQFLE